MACPTPRNEISSFPLLSIHDLQKGWWWFWAQNNSVQMGTPSQNNFYDLGMAYSSDPYSFIFILIHKHTFTVFRLWSTKLQEILSSGATNMQSTAEDELLTFLCLTDTSVSSLIFSHEQFYVLFLFHWMEFLLILNLCLLSRWKTKTTETLFYYEVTKLHVYTQ